MAVADVSLRASRHDAGVDSMGGAVPATVADVVHGSGGLAVEEVPVAEKLASRRSRRNAPPEVAEIDASTEDGDAMLLSEGGGDEGGDVARGGAGASGSGAMGVSSVGRRGKNPAAMPIMAKEEPREKCADPEPIEGGVGVGVGDVVDAAGGAGSAGAGKEADVGAKKKGGKGKVKAKEEPAPRPRVRPRARPKPKAK